jgi:hypothetical protein
MLSTDAIHWWRRMRPQGAVDENPADDGVRISTGDNLLVFCSELVAARAPERLCRPRRVGRG